MRTETSLSVRASYFTFKFCTLNLIGPITLFAVQQMLRNFCQY